MRRRRDAAARGMAFVEFALMLPFLLVLALGAVDLGRGFISYVELEQAAQEGALYGSFAPSDHLLIEGRVRSSSTGIVNLTDLSAVDVDVLCPTDVPPGTVGVRIRYTLQIFTPIIGPLLGGSIPLESRSVGTNFTALLCQASP